jgi:RNA binding exosome subunit
MNVIFHRNCLDGVFSSYIAYLTTKLTNEDELNNFIKEIKEAIEMGDNNLTDCTLKEDSHKSNNNN